MIRRSTSARFFIAACLMTAALVSAALVSGCAKPRGGSPAGPPSIRGVITSIDEAGPSVSMRVVWTKDPKIGDKAEFDAAQIAITKGSRVFRRIDYGPNEVLGAGLLRVGYIVEVWFTGPVAESYPVQATADYVLVTGVYDGALPEPPGLQPPPD